MPPADQRYRSRRLRTRYNPFPSPAELDERLGTRRNRARRQRRRDVRSIQGDDPEGELIDQVQRSVNQKVRAARYEHARNAAENRWEHDMQALRNARNVTISHDEEDMFADATDSEAEMTGGRIRMGKGWEEEMAKAIARDKEREQDRVVADRIRSEAGADAKKHGGRVRRTANAISRKLH